MQNTAFFVKKVNNSYAISNQIVSGIFRICQKWQKLKIKAENRNYTHENDGSGP